MAKQKTVTKKTTKVLEMTDALFSQRRRVIKMLYDARSIVDMDLPRIKVRIVEFEKRPDLKILGRCFINKDYITIASDCANWSDDYLRAIVWHELAHAYFNAKHDEKCPLMHPDAADICVSRPVLAKAFKKLAKSRVI